MGQNGSFEILPPGFLFSNATVVAQDRRRLLDQYLVLESDGSNVRYKVRNHKKKKMTSASSLNVSRFFFNSFFFFLMSRAVPSWLLNELSQVFSISCQTRKRYTIQPNVC